MVVALQAQAADAPSLLLRMSPRRAVWSDSYCLRGNMSAPTVFISYSHKDEVWKDRLLDHLGVLREQGLLDLWDDRQIGAGEDWYQKIQNAMNAASVAVLLVSAKSLTSKFILREEMSLLLQRRDKEGLRIFPVIIKSCPWQKVDWLNRMQVRPRDGKPLASFGGNRRDEALSNIATEIYEQFNITSSLSVQQRPESLDPKRISISRLPITGSNLFGRERELQQLDEAWAGQNTHILSLVAWGGVGKSALVNNWLARMAQDNYRSANRVYAWSFYSQGTTDKVVSADQFIEAALVWFGDPDPNKGTPWDKGERLAHLVAAQRTLLVLDGLEPLQNPPGPDEGRLKDQALQTLLRQLAADNKGLCVISTRVAVTDLSAFEGHTATRIDLEHLSPEAGAQVLKAQGVKGTQAELEQASREFDGHSLALTLLGSYLSDVYDGDVNRRGEVSGLEGDVRYGGHAQKVMASYEKWFGEGPELAVLRMLGLFNRPADKDAIAAVRAAPAIPGLTDTLQGLSEPDWQKVLSKLRRAKLLAAQNPNQPGTLDAHPLVREHFGHQLKQTRPDAWREGNSRLYEHLRDTTKEFPDTLEEMAPLYAAIAHGCEAGRHQEALEEVYWRRVQRGDIAFSTHKLGAFGAELTALSGFFDPPWQMPVPGLTRAFRSYVLSEAGYDLQASGQLKESIQPMQASLEAAISQVAWKNAAIGARNLSDTYLIIGDLSQALNYAHQSVELADQSGESFQQIARKATLANTLHQAGRLSEAEDAFREAEKMQNEWQSQFPLLYSVRGFQYCDLLLNQGKYQEVQTRAAQILEWAKRVSEASLLDIALIYLPWGRACLLQNQREATGNFAEARDYLKRAVDGLRQAGRLDYLPRGLLARAELYRVSHEFDRAQADLDEAMRIATRGSMGLYEADCHLEYTRLYLARGEKEQARESLAKAKEMIERTGYHRRDKDVQEIEELLKEE
jgi:tetratricopeptide (TPR) repeat protein